MEIAQTQNFDFSVVRSCRENELRGLWDRSRVGSQDADVSGQLEDVVRQVVERREGHGQGDDQLEKENG